MVFAKPFSQDFIGPMTKDMPRKVAVYKIELTESIAFPSVAITELPKLIELVHESFHIRSYLLKTVLCWIFRLNKWIYNEPTRLAGEYYQDKFLALCYTSQKSSRDKVKFGNVYLPTFQCVTLLSELPRLIGTLSTLMIARLIRILLTLMIAFSLSLVKLGLPKKLSRVPRETPSDRFPHPGFPLKLHLN